MEWFMWCDKKNTNWTIFTGWIFKLIIISTRNWPGYAYFDSMNYISVKKIMEIIFQGLKMTNTYDFLRFYWNIEISQFSQDKFLK